MKHTFQRITILLLALFVIMTLASVSYSQKIDEQIITQELQTDQLLEKVLQSVIWIRTPNGGEASGVLISKSLGLAVTNAHVTKSNERINIYFPSRDSEGNLISDREFYTNKKHSDVLMRLGYSTSGRVIAENAKTDLAIVSLDGVPQTAREIDLDLMYPFHYTMDIGEPIYILGNPAGRELWRPEAGHFKGYAKTKNAIQITASVYFGNSGGP